MWLLSFKFGCEQACLLRYQQLNRPCRSRTSKNTSGGKNSDSRDHVNVLGDGTKLVNAFTFLLNSAQISVLTQGMWGFGRLLLSYTFISEYDYLGIRTSGNRLKRA